MLASLPNVLLGKQRLKPACVTPSTVKYSKLQKKYQGASPPLRFGLYSQDFLCMCYFTNFWSSLQCQESDPNAAFKKYAHTHTYVWASQVALVVKDPPNAGNIRDTSSIPEWRRPPGGGHSNPLQYSCLENPVNRGAWRATIHRFTKSWTRLKQLSMHVHTHTHTHTHIHFAVQ